MRNFKNKPLTDKQRYMENWINDLKSWGILGGQKGEPLESMDYYDLRNLVMKEQDRREDEEEASRVSS